MRSDWGDSSVAMIDTNVLVYAHDTTTPEKQEIAIALIERLARERRMAISVQVLNEFYNIAVSPRKPLQMSHERAVNIITTLMEAAQVLPLTPAITRRALYGVERYQLAFWDALIWAAAREYGIPTLYTEDFNPGATLEGVVIVNPFAESGV